MGNRYRRMVTVHCASSEWVWWPSGIQLCLKSTSAGIQFTSDRNLGSSTLLQYIYNIQKDVWDTMDFSIRRRHRLNTSIHQRKYARHLFFFPKVSIHVVRTGHALPFESHFYIRRYRLRLFIFDLLEIYTPPFVHFTYTIFTAVHKSVFSKALQSSK